jgi:hypothetical protein
MLYLSLFLSLILLILANRSARRPDLRIGVFVLCGVGFVVVPVGLGIFFPPVAMLFLFLFFALLVRYAYRQKQWRFLPLSLAAFAAAFGIAVGMALPAQREFARLRKLFPYESMEERVPAPRQAFRHQQLPEDAAQRLARLEETLAIKSRGSFAVYMLRQLHEETVWLFVNSPGFGVARVMRPSEASLTSSLGQREETVIPQPDLRTDHGWSPDEVKWERRTWGEDLFRVHRDSVMDFASPDRFGFVKDRRHVAGFRAHQFSQVPESADGWAVQTVDLVGLLLHDEPSAYMSANLPRMDELREAPTRPLNAFEASGLDTLRRGEDLVVGFTTGGMRMLGAIRSTNQCVKCHDGERGDLLGAFSYTLRRDKR